MVLKKENKSFLSKRDVKRLLSKINDRIKNIEMYSCDYTPPKDVDLLMNLPQFGSLNEKDIEILMKSAKKLDPKNDEVL